MPGRVLFKEDFFERVHDINWGSEPEVYWMAGTGAPLIINGMVTGDQHAYAYTSDDGKDWKGEDLWQPGGNGFGAFYDGCWMREGLQEGARPVWVMVGSSSKFVSMSAAGYSTNGKAFGNRTVFDERHAGELIQSTGTGILFQSQFNFPDWHSDIFSSSDGKSWKPGHVHPLEGEGGTFAAAALMATGFSSTQTPTSTPLTRTARVFTPDPEGHLRSLAVPTRSLLVPQMASLADAPSLFASDPAQEKADAMVYIGDKIKATGTIKKGPYSGKKITIEISPYHGWTPDDGAHGDSTVKVSDAKNGKRLGGGNVGIHRTTTISYGHYVFAIGGAGPKQTPTMISYTEDGINWKAQDLGNHSQINTVIAGPRE